EEAEPRGRLGDAPLQELQVGEVLLGVGVEEALGVVAGVGEDGVHLLVEVTALVGHLDGDAVAVDGVDDAAGGHLGLQEADAVLLDDELLLHGLEEGDLLAGVRIAVPGQFLVEFRSHQTDADGFVHRVGLVLDGVHQAAGGGLDLQEHHGGAGHQEMFPQRLVEALPLPGRENHTGNARRPPEEPLDGIVLRYFLGGNLSFFKISEEVRADDSRLQEVPGAH
ncbi:hypothetical protein N303_03383, partial [Cuculus canorus]